MCQACLQNNTTQRHDTFCILYYWDVIGSKSYSVQETGYDILTNNLNMQLADEEEGIRYM